ncbi:MAG: hypothetical protein HKN36_02250 [Hellea sp.]|nr:hypothetical protein [Hellea sp.]
MIKSTLIILASAGVIGTGSHAVGPQAFEISAGNVAYHISADGVETIASEAPQFGVSFITKGDRRITFRF